MKGGINWTLDLQFGFVCRQRTDAGMGFWITKNKVAFLEKDYIYENFQDLHGFSPQIEGVGIIYKGNEVMVSFVNNDRVDMQNFIPHSKVCKIHQDSKDNFRISIRYTENKFFSVYIRNTEIREETLCFQSPSMINFEEFYLGFSASDLDGQCNADIREAIMHSDVNTPIIPFKDKILGDAFYSYMDPGFLSKKQQWEAYNESFIMERERSKILAKELMQFAGQSPEQTD